MSWTKACYQCLWISGLQMASYRACQTIWSHGPITLIHLSANTSIVVATFLIVVTKFLAKQFKEGFIFGPLYRGLVHHDREGMVTVVL